MKKSKIKTVMRSHQMMYCMYAILLGVYLLGLLMDPTEIFSIGGFGLNVAGLMAIGDIADVSDRDTHGSNIAYEVSLISVDQLDMTKPFPVPNGSREVGQIPMAPGEKMMMYYAHDIPIFNSTCEKGDITTSGTNNFSLIMGGMRDNVLDMQEKFIGAKFIILFHEVGNPQWYIIGSKDRPMIFSSCENKNDKDGRYATWNFTRTSIDQYYKYKGAIVRVERSEHTQGQTKLTLKPGVSEYNLPNGLSSGYKLATVGGITASDKGRIVTLYGNGSDYPATISENTVFILEDGEEWTGQAGSRITFQVFDANTLVEVPGSRVQTA